MNRDQKAAAVERISSEIQQADAVLALDYRGISVKQAADLRTALLEANASFRVVKNTLTERAADSAGAESLKELLEGPTALTFVRGDVALAAKALAAFRRREGVLEVKGGQMDGEPLSVDQIEAIARLPTRDVLHGQFVAVLASPLTTLVRGLAGMIAGLAVALREIEDKGLVGGTAVQTPAGEETAATGAGGSGDSAPAEAPAEVPAAAEPAAEAGQVAGEPTPDPAAPEAPAAEEPAAEAGQATAEPPEAEPTPDPAAPDPAGEQPSEAPGDPVAEAEAAEAEQPAPAAETSQDTTPSVGEAESQEG